LSHHLAQSADAEFKAGGDARLRAGPGDVLLEAAMTGTENLARSVMEPDGGSEDGKVSPDAGFGEPAQDAAAASAFGTAGTVFVGLNAEVKFLAAVFKDKSGDSEFDQA
jgi:hypothetical protein